MTRTGGVRSRAAAAAARTPAGRAWRAAKLLLKAVAAVVMIAVVALGLLYVRLMHSPVALGFLVHPIETGIAEELAGAGVRIESVALRLNEDGLLRFELKNVRISDAAGEPLVAAPTAAISLSRRALLRGRIAAESLDLMSARLLLFYSEDGSLSLKFSPAAHASEPGGRGRQASPPGAIHTPHADSAPHGDDAGTLGRIDLVKMLSEASARARRREHAGAYLREVGLRSAIVIIDNGERKSIWRVPELDLDLDHRRSRSSIAGRAKIESLTGPWEINFRSREHVNAKSVHLAISVQGLVPRGLARSLPELVGLERVDLPIWGDAQLELSNTGEILAGKIVVDSAPGNLSLPWLMATPLRLDGGHLELTYDGAARRFDIAQAVLTWGDSRLQLAGSVVHAGDRAQEPRWTFDLNATGGSIAAEPPARAQLPVEQLALRGFVVPARGHVALSEFLLRVGGTQVNATGEVSELAGAVKARVDARIGAMAVPLFKTLWPSWIAPGARAWVGTRLHRGDIHGGAFKLVRGYGSTRDGYLATGEADRVSLTLEGSKLEFGLVEGWPGLQIARGLLHLNGDSVEFAVPEASMSAADGRKLSLKGAFSVDLREPLPHRGQIALRSDGPLSLALELLDRQGVHALQNTGLAVAGIDGKLDANVTIKLPLVPNSRLHDARLEGRLRVTDGRVRHALGSFDAQGVNLVIDLMPSAAEAKGEFLIKGVPAKASWQRIYDSPPDMQPPLQITAKLDESQRAQLGLDINDMVRGEVGVELTVHQDARGERHVRFRADLMNAKLMLEGLAWEKPIGRACTFEFDLTKGAIYPHELRNVRLVGDDVAVAGWMGAGADFRIREFRFPQFSLNVVTVFETHGKLRADNVWEVTAKGPTFDGKDLFQSFFDIDVAVDRGAKNRPGLDLRAEIETVMGFYDTRLHNVRVSMQKRAGKMSQLDARGSFGGNKAIEAGVRNDPGRPRLLTAKSNDAGQTFKLVGFYPHAIGGDMYLEVNLDGKGFAERTGTLTATKFQVLGDTVSVQNLPKTDAAARREVARERFDFDSLHAPFSVGHGQFVLHNAAIEGPLVSANMRGKLDFRTRKLYVGGTFTPLSALNKLFSGVPVFGDIVTGPRRDGVIAMTYALKGGLENPQLEVNPLSMFTPGITRELMQITPNDASVVPRSRPGAARTEKGPRSSSSPATGGRPDGAGEDNIDGWTSETVRARKR